VDDRKPKNTNNIDVRDMELEDLAEVYALGERLFRADSWPNLYRAWEEYELLSHYASDSDTCLVAEINDNIVGFILGSIIEKRRSSWTYGYVVWIGVDPEAKRSGIGTKLLNRVTERFIEQGARLLIVDTQANNTSAISFFQHHGFGTPRQHVYLEKNMSRDPRYANKLEAHRNEKRGEKKQDKKQEKQVGESKVKNKSKADTSKTAKTESSKPKKKTVSKPSKKAAAPKVTKKTPSAKTTKKSKPSKKKATKKAAV
jgi:ribosomal protein S18 acetylase RimI-like enzyme